MRSKDCDLISPSSTSHLNVWRSTRLCVAAVDALLRSRNRTRWASMCSRLRSVTVVGDE